MLNWERLQKRLLDVVKDEVKTAAKPIRAAVKGARTGGGIFDSLNDFLTELGDVEREADAVIDVEPVERTEGNPNP